ncbi:SET domain-containing protein [Patellaria atrata CBS 101060]|uniref:SET domain-containing protein n=1 Tax=Patellaria atrata CBS 101060 TaxID=1346257 RepID=A0A9P4SGY7_9PEZI|nr:SET domain-containing protein [Patellaria atrata CBS 101060]
MLIVTATGNEKHVVDKWGTQLRRKSVSRKSRDVDPVDAEGFYVQHVQKATWTQWTQKGFYVQRVQRSNPLKKRKASEFDGSTHLNAFQRSVKLKSRSPSVLSSTSESFTSKFNIEHKHVKIYNGVLKQNNGFLEVERSTNPNVAQLEARRIPTESMINEARQTLTVRAANKIRVEIQKQLARISGPPVRLANTIDESSPPLRFEWIDENILGEGVQKADADTMLGCQSCRPDMGQNIGCEYTKKCDCLEFAAVNQRRLTEAQRYKLDHGDGDSRDMPKRFPYHNSGASAGCLVSFYLESRAPIYECNAKCRCGMGCKNRNVQFGRQVELEIFKTADRGWGLRTKSPLKRGQFIDTYRGEIITDAEATRRETTIPTSTPSKAALAHKDSYLYTLDKFTSPLLPLSACYIIDGSHTGGPTRFINHSCAPNCRQYTVSYNKYDQRVYEIAFFAYRDIEAGEELTFDYLDKDEVEEGEEDGEREKDQGKGKEGREKEREREEGMSECRCGASRCRKWLWM